MVEFDQVDQALLDKRIAARSEYDEPMIGDFVVFPTGEVERICNEMSTSVQTCPPWAGSFHLFADGSASFSGSLNPPIPTASLLDTGDTQDGKFWFFHHDFIGAHRGVQCEAPCRLWVTNAPYKGYLTKGI